MLHDEGMEQAGAQRIVTLTTDFSMQDGFVGAMKGVLLGINPRVQIVDIAHDIRPQDILEAAFVLTDTYGYFPRGTIHLVVVDPGVGSARRPIIVQSEDYFFVGPDNGVFGFVYDLEEAQEIVQISNPNLMMPEVSDTFHGRDVFAPAAAYLSTGVMLSQFGPPVLDPVRLEFPEPRIEENALIGEVIRIDHFGNLITNISRSEFQEFVGDHGFEIIAGAVGLRKVEPSYAAVPKGAPVAIFSSSGFLEIAVNYGRAHDVLKMGRGEPIRVVRMD